LDAVVEHTEDIGGKRGASIAEAADRLPLNQQLVALKRDVEIDFDLDDARVGAIDASGLQHAFRELGLRRHQNDLDKLLSKTDLPTSGTADRDTPPDDGFADGLFDGGTDASAAGAATDRPDFADATEGDYRGLLTRDEVEAYVAQAMEADIVAVDTETIGLGHRATPCGICLATETGSGVYIPMRSPEPDRHLGPDEVLELVRPLLESENVRKCGHNLKYDRLVLRHAGIDLAGETFDTMIASWLTGQPGHGMDDLALSLLKYEAMPITALIGPRGKEQRTMDQVDLDRVITYSAEDADLTLRLYHEFVERLEAMDLTETAREVEMPLVAVLAEMEFNGIRIDKEVLTEQREALSGRIEILAGEIHERSGNPDFNIDSPMQLSEVLFEELGFTPGKKTKTGYSTASGVLEKLAEEEDPDQPHTAIPRLVLEYRQLTKLVNTYLTALADAADPETGRIHATFHQTGTATGRLSSSHPNLQNIPVRTEVGRQVRRAFVAEPDHRLICADYSQVELRVLAHLSEDEDLIAAFEADRDIHTAVACEVFDLEPDEVTPDIRTQAKSINFGIVYGVTPWGLSRSIDNLDPAGARDLIDRYKRRFPGIDRFLETCIEAATSQGYVETILGHRRDIPQIHSSNPNTRALGERLAINTVVQGSAADLIKIAMVNLQHRIEQESLPLKLLLQIHDELVLESPTDRAEAMLEIVSEEMTGAMDLKVPVIVDAAIGEDWLAAK
ncbi:MAG: DNA polymerase I, partial [Phycisphaeraceae bacterium]|nr:DNA polymerase I [Phycisphaeraceae bacterium]